MNSRSWDRRRYSFWCMITNGLTWSCHSCFRQCPRLELRYFALLVQVCDARGQNPFTMEKTIGRIGLYGRQLIHLDSISNKIHKCGVLHGMFSDIKTHGSSADSILWEISFELFLENTGSCFIIIRLALTGNAIMSIKRSLHSAGQKLVRYLGYPADKLDDPFKDAFYSYVNNGAVKVLISSIVFSFQECVLTIF